MRVRNLYNLESFQAFTDSARRPGFCDSYAGTVLARNLTAVDPQIFVKRYPELTFVNSGIVADNTGGYARRIQSMRKRGLGGFTTAGDASGNKGKISLAGEDSTIRVVERESHSEWSDSEIKEAELQNINLPADYVTEHNRLYLREVDEIGYLGLPDIADSEGLLNYSGFTSDSAADVVGNLTAQQMYDEISDLITSQRNAVNNTPEYTANRVDMPVSVFNVLNSTILDTANGSGTVMRALRDNFPDVEFRATFRAEDVGGSSATVAYSNNTEVLKMRIPLALTVGEIVRQSSFDFRVDSKYRIAGLDVLEEAGAYILTGL